MRITRIEASNILSFARFELNLDSHSTVIVGPNGAGKSNLIKLVDLVTAGMLWADVQTQVPGLHELLEGYATARFRGARPDEETEVRVSVDLSEGRERELLVAYVQAAVYTSLANATQGWDIGYLERWADTHLTWERIAAFGDGAIVMRHPGYQGGQWWYEYEFTHQATTFVWTVGPFGAAEGIVRKGAVPTSRKSVAERLWSAPQSPQEKPGPPVDSFRLEQLLPGEDEQLVLKVEGPQQWPGPRLFRRFAEIAGITEPVPGGRQYSFARVLRRSLETSLRVVSVPTALDGGQIPHAIPGRYAWDDMYAVLPARDPGLLPLRLFRLKNGSATERTRYAAVQELFSRLGPGRHLDLTFDVTPPPAAQPSLMTNAPTSPQAENPRPIGVTVLVEHDDAGVELPIQLTGAGTQEALVLAEALADAAGSVVILDEPALNLQPGWQALIRNLLSTATGQFITITHSPQLVPAGSADDLMRIARLTRTSQSGTLAFRLGHDPSARETARLVKELASMEARSLLFAMGVILVEGETEEGALPIWCARSNVARTRYGPDYHHLEFYSVGGESHFEVFLSYLHGFAVPWVALCDGHAFTPGKHNIMCQVVAASAGTSELPAFISKEVPKISAMNADAFGRLVARAGEEGIYTVARGWTLDDKDAGVSGDESFEAFVEDEHPGALERAKREVGTSKVRQGRWVAERYTCPPAIGDFYGRVLDRFGLAEQPIA